MTDRDPLAADRCHQLTGRDSRRVAGPGLAAATISMYLATALPSTSVPQLTGRTAGALGG